MSVVVRWLVCACALGICVVGLVGFLYYSGCDSIYLPCSVQCAVAIEVYEMTLWLSD